METSQNSAAFDSRRFREVLGEFVTGVTVMTARDGDRAAGITVSSFNTLSLDPPLILWSLNKASPSLSLFKEAKVFGVNILARDQAAIASQFSRPSPDKFNGVEVVEGEYGVPLIGGTVAHFECAMEHCYPGGDHEIIVGRVLSMGNREQAPLIYHKGRFDS